jgi:hypothetical protein
LPWGLIYVLITAWVTTGARECLVSIDGSSTDLPDSKDNRRVFGGPGNDKRDGAFPQVRWMAAAESGTGALIEATFGPYAVGEQTLTLDLLGAFTPEMLVLADRQFLSYTLVRDTLATGAHILWRASASFTLRPVKVLAEGTYLAQLHPARKSARRATDHRPGDRVHRPHHRAGRRRPGNDPV